MGGKENLQVKPVYGSLKPEFLNVTESPEHHTQELLFSRLLLPCFCGAASPAARAACAGAGAHS